MNQIEIQRSAYLGFAHVVTLVAGVRSGFPAAGEALIDALLGWSIGFALVLACVTDAKLRQQPIPRIMQLLMLLTWPVALPIYGFIARRWAGLGWCLLLAVTLFMCLVLGVLGFIAVTGEDPLGLLLDNPSPA